MSAGQNIKLPRLLGAAGLFNAIQTTILSAAFISALLGVTHLQGQSRPHLADVLMTALWLVPFTAVWCGTYGLLSGVAGFSWLYWRRRRFATKKRLYMEAALVGIVLAAAFPLFDRAINRYTTPLSMVLGIPLGILCACTCAAVFRKNLLTQ